MRSLITGANGFIGQHLVEELKKRDITPIAVPRILLYSDTAVLGKFIFDSKPDYIFHLASYGNHSNQKDDTSAVMAGIISTYNILKASEFYDYKAFINVATSSIYGDSLDPMDEQAQFLPDTFYAAGKAGGAYIARAFAKEYKKPVVTAVPFSVYGEGEADFRFIPRVCKSLQDGTPMPLDPYANHDWIYIKDFINGLFTLTENVDKLCGSWVNIGSGLMWTNAEVVKMLESVSKKKLQIEGDYNARKFDAKHWKAENGLLKSLGWKAETTLGKGLANCWEYYSGERASVKRWGNGN